MHCSTLSLLALEKYLKHRDCFKIFVNASMKQIVGGEYYCLLMACLRKPNFCIINIEFIIRMGYNSFLLQVILIGMSFILIHSKFCVQNEFEALLSISHFLGFMCMGAIVSDFTL